VEERVGSECTCHISNQYNIGGRLSLLLPCIVGAFINGHVQLAVLSGIAVNQPAVEVANNVTNSNINKQRKAGKRVSEKVSGKVVTRERKKIKGP
jgi:hypothetical protein